MSAWMIRKFKIKLLPSSFGLREFFSGSSWYTSAWATILCACLHTCSGSYLLSLLLLEGHNISGPSLKDTSNILQNFRKLSQLDCLNTTIGYVYLKAKIYIIVFALEVNHYIIIKTKQRKKCTYQILTPTWKKEEWPVWFLVTLKS